MPSVPTRVRHAITRGDLLPPGARVVVALSGGSDSVALTHLLVDLAPVCGFAVAGVAHLNHQLRGLDSDEDEAFCTQLATALSLPIETHRQDVGRLARARRVSVEVAARRARYRFLERAAARLDADTIATGHTRDDQAETFLLRLLRGAGATGLAAIPPRRDTIVRPLLGVGRDELRAYLAGRGAGFREDLSNRDTAIPRNWVRHVLLPMLAGHLGGDVVGVLAREAAILREDGSLLDEVAAEASRSLVVDDADRGVMIGAPDLLALPPAIARRVARRALARVSPAFQGAAHADRVLAAARRGEGKAMDLPGTRVERIGQNVVLKKRAGRRVPAAEPFRFALPVPGAAVVEPSGVVVEADFGGGAGDSWPPADQLAAGVAGVIDQVAAGQGLWVRSRRPGDTFRPLGLGRRKKLQDVFVDRKIPRDRRDVVPLVVDGHDRIVWVAGVGPSDDARVTGTTTGVVTLKVRELGDIG